MYQWTGADVLLKVFLEFLYNKLKYPIHYGNRKKSNMNFLDVSITRSDQALTNDIFIHKNVTNLTI